MARQDIKCESDCREDIINKLGSFQKILGNVDTRTNCFIKKSTMWKFVTIIVSICLAVFTISYLAYSAGVKERKEAYTAAMVKNDIAISRNRETLTKSYSNLLTSIVKLEGRLTTIEKFQGSVDKQLERMNTTMGHMAQDIKDHIINNERRPAQGK